MYIYTNKALVSVCVCLCVCVCVCSERARCVRKLLPAGVWESDARQERERSGADRLPPPHHSSSFSSLSSHSPSFSSDSGSIVNHFIARLPSFIRRASFHSIIRSATQSFSFMARIPWIHRQESLQLDRSIPGRKNPGKRHRSASP